MPNRTFAIITLLLVFLVSACSYQSTSSTRSSPQVVATHTPVPTAIPPTPTPTPVPTLPTVSPRQILGIEGDPSTSYGGVNWVRLGYPTCGWGHLTGKNLKSAVDQYHVFGVRVLLTVCQGPNDARLYDINKLNDAAQGNPDAVQCGNEEMKYDPSVAFLYIPPENFAKFYDACEHAMHAVRPDIPVLLGSLDPHVGGIDYQPLLNQVYYLDQMQYAMNTVVRPGGHWDWHTHTLGLIDSWHNGYPDASVNSLYNLFLFWAQQFGVDLNSGGLGKHLWVVEGTGCFKGCGVPDSDYAIAVAHILALIIDVQTSINDGIPFFYFSGKDFNSAGYHWPIGVLDVNGHAKPIRQDLSMGARVLDMTCGSTIVNVTDQEDLLVRLYSGCSLPENYVGILVS